MGTLIEAADLVRDNLRSIRDAIRDKGVSVPLLTPSSEYPAKIAQIVGSDSGLRPLHPWGDWRLRTDLSSTSVWQGIATNKRGLWIAVGTQVIATSTNNGDTWETRSIINVQYGKFTDIIYIDELELFVLCSSEGTHRITLTRDGHDFENLPIANGTFQNLCYSQEARAVIVVATTSTAVIMRASIDSIRSWSVIAVPAGTATMRRVESVGKTFLAVSNIAADTVKCIGSANGGLAWEDCTNSLMGTTQIYGLMAANGRYVIVTGGSPRIIYSDDMHTWLAGGGPNGFYYSGVHTDDLWQMVGLNTSGSGLSCNTYFSATGVIWNAVGTSMVVSTTGQAAAYDGVSRLYAVASVGTAGRLMERKRIDPTGITLLGLPTGFTIRLVQSGNTVKTYTGTGADLVLGEDLRGEYEVYIDFPTVLPYGPNVKEFGVRIDDVPVGATINAMQYLKRLVVPADLTRVRIATMYLGWFLGNTSIGPSAGEVFYIPTRNLVNGASMTEYPNIPIMYYDGDRYGSLQFNFDGTDPFSLIP